MMVELFKSTSQCKTRTALSASAVIGRTVLLAACAVTGASLPAVSSAQVLEEIVVTAQKREESIQDVGIAMTAFSGDQLRDLGYTNSMELTSLSPGVHFSSTTATQYQQFTIRGVTQSDFADHTEPPNAVYIDEGYVASPQAQVFAMFDLDRVEILKGPQGTLFGRNATGGLAHFITRKPTRELEGYGEVTYGSYNRAKFEGAVSGPLTSRLAGRVSLMYNRHDNVGENLFPFGQPTNPVTGVPLAPGNAGQADVRDDDQYAWRAQLLWNINDDADLLVSVFNAQQLISQGNYSLEGTAAVIDAQGRHVNTLFPESNSQSCESISAETGGCLPIGFLDFEVPAFLAAFFPGFPLEDAVRPDQFGDLLGFVDPDIGNFDGSYDHSPENADRYQTRGATGKLTWDLSDTFLGSNVVLTSVSHYAHFDKRISLDDGGATPWLEVSLAAEHDTFAQELRLNGELERARWVAGFYFLSIDVTTSQALGFGPGSPITFMFSPAVTGTNLPFDAPVFTDLQTESYSLFGQLDMDLTERLTFIAGVRTIREDKEYTYSNEITLNVNSAIGDPASRAFAVPAFDPVSAPLGKYPSFADDTSDTLWAGKLQFDYKPNDDWLLYAGINRGVKAGGFNAKLYDFGVPLPDSDIPYGEETLFAYEVGLKATVLSGTTRINASAYYYDYDDYQAFQFVGIGGRIQNADAKFKGIEVEVLSNPIDGLDFLFSASFIDAEVTNLAVADNIFKDVTPAFTPSVQLGGLLRYALPTRIFGGTLAAQMDANYVSSSFNNLRNFSSHKMPAYVTGNARLFWTSPDERWDASFFVTNLADARNRVTAVDISTLCGCQQVAFANPRWFGGTIRFNY